MLKEFSILIIAVAVITAAEPFMRGKTLRKGGITGCRVSRKDCNVCGCMNDRPICTTIDCATLPDDVKKGNTVADRDLPLWPDNLAVSQIGQVYKWHGDGFCVLTPTARPRCYENH